MKLVKTHWIWVVALLAASCSTETVRVSDEVVARDYDFDTFTALEVATDFNAYVNFSDTEQRVRIEANSNLFDKLDVFQQNEKLIVKVKNNVNIKGKETLNLFITAKEITDFEASSNASIFLDAPLNTTSASVVLSSDAHFDGDITADNFTMEVSSNSRAKLYLDSGRAAMNFSSGAELEGEVAIDQADVKLSSDSDIDVVGDIRTLNAVLSSNSRFKDYALQVEQLRIVLSSDSDAFLTVSETIDITASSNGKLFYKGNAEVIRQDLSSEGAIIKK